MMPRTLQSALTATTAKFLSYPILAELVVKKRLEALGVKLLKRDREVVKERCRDFDPTAPGSNWTVTVPVKGRRKTPRDYVFDLSAAESELLAAAEKVKDIIAASVPKSVAEVVPKLLKELKDSAPRMLAERRRAQRAFEARLHRTWKPALDLLAMFIVVACETGEEFNHEFRVSAQGRCRPLVDALTRLHARGCQIAREVLVLLHAGYADGAQARWRSLHEVCIVGEFLLEHGDEVAERYLSHDVVGCHKAARVYRDHACALGHKRVAKEELVALGNAVDDLKKKYGESFGGEYGWAAGVLRGDPDFTRIEASLGMSHWRPYYRMASNGVHANPRGLFTSLAHYRGTQQVLLTGPSNSGLANPGHSTALSLGRLTMTLMLTMPEMTLDRLAISKIIGALMKEIGKKFLQAQRRVDAMAEADRQRALTTEVEAPVRGSVGV